MIRLRNDIRPNQSALDRLAEYQKEIDDLHTYEEKSAKAKKSFSGKNTKRNSTFNEVKRCLTEMCNSTRRCVYCEDSLGDEVEHIYPKDLYPEKCFDWDNYVYACGPCNGPKSNKFAVFQNPGGAFVTVNPPRGVQATQPPSGQAAMINPREENPLDFAILDLQGSFQFFPLPGLHPKDQQRVQYTYSEILKLDDPGREPLRKARENAFENYKSRLFYYHSRKNAGATQAQLDRIITGIQQEDHPTVWKEMQRYHQLGLFPQFDSELEGLFNHCPEALTW